MNWNLLAVEKVKGIEYTKNHGLMLSIENFDEPIHILDDEMNKGFLERFDIDPTSVQTVEVIRNNIEKSMKENSYVALYLATLNGLKFFYITQSDVPYYAFRDFYDPSTTEIEKTTIIQLVKAFDKDRNLFNRAIGKYILISNGSLVRRFFTSLRDIPQISSKTDRNLIFCVEQRPSIVYSRMSSCIGSIFSAGSSAKFELPISIYYERIGEKHYLCRNKVFLVDSGCTHTSFPGTFYAPVQVDRNKPYFTLNDLRDTYIYWDATNSRKNYELAFPDNTVMNYGIGDPILSRVVRDYFYIEIGELKPIPLQELVAYQGKRDEKGSPISCEGPLLLGMDALMQLTGHWYTGGHQAPILHLDNRPPMPIDDNIISKNDEDPFAFSDIGDDTTELVNKLDDIIEVGY